MSEPRLQCVFLGLSLTSTWGNGHATTYRALLKELAALGHQITFLERNVPWYEGNREFTSLPYCEVTLYDNLEQLREQYSGLVRQADCVVVGSYVPDGIAVGEWVLANSRGIRCFYDIDTPVTLANLNRGSCEYMSRRQVSNYDLYLSFTGGPTLNYLEDRLGSPQARALYCSVDPSLYFPEPTAKKWELAYIGTYAEDRQPALEELLLKVAEMEDGSNFAVAGPQYPENIVWPPNVQRFAHLPAAEHRGFYNSQAFTLNLTRRDMVRSGYSPSVRLFEAAACGVPIMSDEWPGLQSFFTFGSEILPVRSAADVRSNLRMSPDQRRRIGEAARKRTLRQHTAQVRALELQNYIVAAQERVSHQKSRSKATASRSETAALI